MFATVACTMDLSCHRCHTAQQRQEHHVSCLHFAFLFCFYCYLLFLSREHRRCTQKEETPLTGHNALIPYQERSMNVKNSCFECHTHCRQEGQCEKLAQHTIERAHALCANMSIMVLMMHTLLTTVCCRMVEGVHMERRHQQHWQEHRQQYPRRNMSLCRLFHGCKGSAFSARFALSLHEFFLKKTKSHFFRKANDKNAVAPKPESLTEFNYPCSMFNGV